MPYVRPEVGDIGIIEHYAFSDTYVIVKVVKVTPARLQIMALQPDGTWGTPKTRLVEQFMFVPEDTTMDALMAIREELVEVARACREAIANAKKQAHAIAAMMAAQGKALGA